MLFKTIAEIRLYTSAPNKSMSFDTWKPIIEQCEEDYILPIIGQEQLDELNDQFIGPTLTTENTKLLLKVQRALAYYALYEMQKALLVTVSDMGLTEQQSKEGTILPARQWVADRTEQNVLQRADKFGDRILDFLELNEDDYPLWQASDQYTITKELFINKTTTLSKYVNLQGSKRAYLAIRPFIEQCELEYIKPAIGDEYFADLKAKMISGEFDDNDNAILPILLRSLANQATAEAFPQINIVVDGRGLYVSSTNDGTRTSSAIERSKYEDALKNLQKTATSFLNQLKQYLDDNAEDYPLYGDSDSFLNDQPETDLPDNSNSQSFFV